MTQSGQERRRRYFIDKGFQGKYITLLVVFIIALGVAGLLILWLGSGSTGVEEAKADLNNAVYAMLMVILVFVGFTIWYGIRFSHRVVGPIYAFNRHLNWIKDGNYTRDLKLREKDEFQNLSSVFNNMQASLRQRARENVEEMGKVESGLIELADVLGQDGFDRERAQELIKRLRKEMEAAKVKAEGYITP